MLSVRLHSVRVAPLASGAEGVLLVKARSEDDKVAGAISRRARADPTAAMTVSACGPDSVLCSVHAVDLARRFLAGDHLAAEFAPYFESTTHADGTTGTSLALAIALTKTEAKQ